MLFIKYNDDRIKKKSRFLRKTKTSRANNSIENSEDQEWNIFVVLFFNEHKHIDRFWTLLQSTFKIDTGKEALAVQSQIFNYLPRWQVSVNSFQKLVIYYKKFRSFNFYG